MTVLCLIVGLGQWFLTIFYISFPLIKQDQIYPNSLSGAHLLKIQNIKTLNSSECKNLQWLQFMVR